MAPRSRLTPDVHDAIVRMLASGSFLSEAAQAVGIPRQTVQDWMDKGRLAAELRAAGERVSPSWVRYERLAAAAVEARARAEVTALATIQRAARSGNWQAAAWYLERVNPDLWASPKRRGGTGAGGRPVGAVSAPDRAAEPPRIRRVK